MSAGNAENDNPYTSEAANLPTTQSTGYIHNIEPQFNDSHPSAQQQQQPAPVIDYTAPQQPYFINPCNNNNAQTVELPNSGYVGNQGAFVLNLDFLKSISGILNIIAIVSLYFVFHVLNSVFDLDIFMGGFLNFKYSATFNSDSFHHKIILK